MFQLIKKLVEKDTIICEIQNSKLDLEEKLDKAKCMLTAPDEKRQKRWKELQY